MDNKKTFDLLVEPFSLSTYKLILESVLDQNYMFTKFSDFGSAKGKNELHFFLRHDVDISPSAALQLGKIEKELGVKANYYFQLNADTYSMLSVGCLKIMESLRSMGHEVGLHIDTTVLPQDEIAIEDTISWFDRYIMPIDKSVSFHRPSSTVIGKNFDSFINTYSHLFFGDDKYLSDSRGSWFFYETLGKWIAKKKPIIQLLLHPCWWSNVSDRKKLYALFMNARMKEITLYMQNNFKKAFPEVFDD